MSWFKNDVLVGLLQDQNKRLTDQNAWLQSQVVRLQDKLLEMKQQGFVHEPTVVQTRMMPELPDVVGAAIESVSRPNTQLAGELTEYALRMLAAEVDPEHLADQILKGGTFDA